MHFSFTYLIVIKPPIGNGDGRRGTGDSVMIKTRESLSVSQIFGAPNEDPSPSLPRLNPSKPAPSLQARIALVLGMIAICASLGVLVGNAMRTHGGGAQIHSDNVPNDPTS